MKNKHIILFSILLLTLILFVSNSDIVYAADKVVNLDAEDQLNVVKIKSSFSSAFGENFSNDISALYLSFQHIARIIVVIMTALAGVMIAFGLGGANQLFFKWIFGVGVALNIADVGWSLYGEYWVEPEKIEASNTQEDLDKITKIHSAKENDSSFFDVFSHFMNYYTNAFINPAYSRLMPIAVKLTMVLWCIDTAMKVALGLTQQDLINFFVKQFLKLGIYIFLITNWWEPVESPNMEKVSTNAGGNLKIMCVLGDGFESLGYYAAGGGKTNNDLEKSTDGEKIVLNSNSIFKNSMALWSTMWGAMMNDSEKDKQGIKGWVKEHIPGAKTLMAVGEGGLLFVVNWIFLLWIMVLLFYMALEMFMVRLEFYTMAVLSIMLLPFAMIDQLKFLADKAISLMFNLALKCFIIAFLSVGIVKVLETFVTKAKADEGFLAWYLNPVVIIQLILILTLLALIVKKIPQLCNGLLSGNPSLSGGDLMGQIKETVSTTVKTAATAAAVVVTGGAAAAGAAAATSGGMAAKLGAGLKGGAQALGRGAFNYVATQNPASQAFARGMNLFGGTGTSRGLMQEGATAQHLGLAGNSYRDPNKSTSVMEGLAGIKDKFDPSKKDKDNDSSKNSDNSTNNNNQNTPASTSSEKTIEKQIDTINEKMDRIERIITGGANPSVNPANPSNPAVNLSKDGAGNAQNYDKTGKNEAPMHPSFNPKNLANSTGGVIPAFNSTLAPSSQKGLQYVKMPSSDPGNVSSDGQFTKAQVSSPNGGKSYVAWIPSDADAIGKVSTQNLIKHPKPPKDTQK